MTAPSDDFDAWLAEYEKVRESVARHIDEDTLVPLVRLLAFKLAFACERIEPHEVSPVVNDFELSVLQKLIQEMNAFVECAYGGSTFGTMSSARAALETAALARYVLADPERREGRLADWEHYYSKPRAGRPWYREKLIKLVEALGPGDSSAEMYRATSKAVHLSPIGKRLTSGLRLFHYDDERRYARESASFAKAVLVIIECLPCRGELLLKEVANEVVDLTAAVSDSADQLMQAGTVTYSAPTTE